MKNKAFTLVELIVAVAIFSIVITMAFGSFSAAIKAQRRVILLQDIQENAKFILEFMTKETRMSIINNTSNGSTSELNIVRNTASGTSVVYSFANGKLLRNNVSMNSDNVNITGSFYISGVVSGDKTQPKLTILMKLNYPGNEEIVVETQATLCQRFLDFE
jgi:prepilin-type N-terminal cleavage/methylation domain-containing protein